MGILDQTGNILDLYMHATGLSEIPPEWHQWCCLSLISAAVSDRVWYQKFAWEKMAPNMYIFLVGGSAAGKGAAIGFAQQFLHPRMNPYNGSTTYKHMVDMMASPPLEGCPERSKMFLMQAELADCIGSGALANAMVKAMTEWYTPSEQDFNEATRTHGEKHFSSPTITWLAGTTTEWLSECVDVKAMRSGFFGRVAVAPGKYNPKIRIYQPQVPCDYEEVKEYIKDRIMWLTTLEGEMHLSEAAYLIDKEWYETRPEPETEDLRPFWRRQHDLNLKVAMLLSLSESMNKVVHERHILQAQELTDASARMLPRIVSDATSTFQTQKIDVVRSHIKRFTPIKHSLLLKKVNRFHILTDELKKIVEQLIDEGVVESKPLSGGGRKYVWVPPRKLHLPKE